MNNEEPSLSHETADVARIDPQWLGKWLKAMQEQQIQQTKYLKNISTTATIVGLLILFGFVLGACSALGLFGF